MKSSNKTETKSQTVVSGNKLELNKFTTFSSTQSIELVRTFISFAHMAFGETANGLVKCSDVSCFIRDMRTIEQY